LPLVKRLIELHGGWMTLESEPGKGTRASLYFPAPDTRGAHGRA
jgi:signal transduction histidine kinase